MRVVSEGSTGQNLSMLNGTSRDTDIKFRIASLFWIAAMAILAVPMVTLVDVRIARWFSHDPLPSEIGDMLDLTGVLCHGGGIFLILLGIALMAPSRRWHLPRLASLALGAGAVATMAKMFILRPRPSSVNLDGATYDTAWIWFFDWNLTQVAAFDASTRAFPSGNVATATALTVGLWVVLPRGRWLFATLCLGTMAQRLYCGSHFMSDLFGGTACGLLWAYACFHPKLLGSVFEKMEPNMDDRRRRHFDPLQEAETVDPDLTIDESETSKPQTSEPARRAA